MDANCVVGAEFFIVTPGSWTAEYKLTKVVKVTPSGQVTVEAKDHQGNGRRFTPRGEEIGGYKFRTPFLAWNVAQIKAQLANDACCRAAAEKLSAATKVEYRREWGAESALEKIAAMRKLLDEAEAALKV